MRELRGSRAPRVSGLRVRVWPVACAWAGFRSTAIRNLSLRRAPHVGSIYAVAARALGRSHSGRARPRGGHPGTRLLPGFYTRRGSAAAPAHVGATKRLHDPARPRTARSTIPLLVPLTLLAALC